MSGWQSLVDAKQRELTTAIPPQWRVPDAVLADCQANRRLIEQRAVQRCGILSQAELDMTEKYSAAELLQKLATRQFTSVEVTTAFAKRAAIAQQLTCCLTEIFFERGLERASWLDHYLEHTGTVYGPLHGLPVSCKDSYQVEGTHATGGFVALLKQRSRSNSAMADLLLAAGAVLYVKTNIPQTLMTADSENNIYGRTLNPHNTLLTAGGSTGGEGALLALRGSPLGVGSDIAGSVRIPALCCGIYGFKPSPGRLPLGGFSPGPGPHLLPNLEPVAGPLGSCVADLALFMRAAAACHAERYDPGVLPLPWRESGDGGDGGDGLHETLRIGVLPEDAAFPLHPPVRRALAAAAAALEAAGHELVRLPADPARTAERATRIAWGYFSLDGPHFRGDLLAEAGEPLIKSVAASCHPYSPERPPIADLDKMEWRAALTALAGARWGYAEAWGKTWAEERLDVVLAPGAQVTAVPHDTYGCPPYTLMWNVIDYAGCIIPFGRASKALDPDPVVYGVPFQPDYDPAATDGAPCAVQVVAPKFQDEKCLRAAAIIDEVLRGAEMA